MKFNPVWQKNAVTSILFLTFLGGPSSPDFVAILEKKFGEIFSVVLYVFLNKDF